VTTERAVRFEIFAAAYVQRAKAIQRGRKHVYDIQSEEEPNWDNDQWCAFYAGEDGRQPRELWDREVEAWNVGLLVHSMLEAP
jgi:hypothetical protein